jgi:hypothetical protein
MSIADARKLVESFIIKYVEKIAPGGSGDKSALVCSGRGFANNKFVSDLVIPEQVTLGGQKQYFHQ